MSWKLVGVATMALAVAACGTNSQDRTTGGAAAGAAAGAGVGALGGPVGALAGAAIGGGAGAITGATTSARDVNLGTPPWSNPEVRTPVDGQRNTPTTRREQQAAARARQAEQDRAYMGGGMVGGTTGPGYAQAQQPGSRTGTGSDQRGTTGSVSPQPPGMNAPPATGSDMRTGPTTSVPQPGSVGTMNPQLNPGSGAAGGASDRRGVTGSAPPQPPAR